ncbi:hypothetical protein [Diatraea saccharalis granulovirus]|uniref:Uncharacterized protein n=1 Tax=Diatraea saccharalis granulovirus TaxID=1675862 RepID=A0A0R7EYR0_9BBAC|nr:hypothetical protein [Diatraea saccharalis granulovirus]AKN80722.1 hypothetical protein [Diatraea saccharalis granulovirus]
MKRSVAGWVVEKQQCEDKEKRLRNLLITNSGLRLQGGRWIDQRLDLNSIDTEELLVKVLKKLNEGTTSTTSNDDEIIVDTRNNLLLRETKYLKRPNFSDVESVREFILQIGRVVVLCEPSLQNLHSDFAYLAYNYGITHTPMENKFDEEKEKRIITLEREREVNLRAYNKLKNDFEDLKLQYTDVLGKIQIGEENVIISRRLQEKLTTTEDDLNKTREMLTQKEIRIRQYEDVYRETQNQLEEQIQTIEKYRINLITTQDRLKECEIQNDSLKNDLKSCNDHIMNIYSKAETTQSQIAEEIRKRDEEYRRMYEEYNAIKIQNEEIRKENVYLHDYSNRLKELFKNFITNVMRQCQYCGPRIDIDELETVGIILPSSVNISEIPAPAIEEPPKASYQQLREILNEVGEEFGLNTLDDDFIFSIKKELGRLNKNIITLNVLSQCQYNTSITIMDNFEKCVIKLKGIINNIEVERKEQIEIIENHHRIVEKMKQDCNKDLDIQLNVITEKHNLYSLLKELLLLIDDFVDIPYDQITESQVLYALNRLKNQKNFLGLEEEDDDDDDDAYEYEPSTSKLKMRIKKFKKENKPYENERPKKMRHVEYYYDDDVDDEQNLLSVP